MSDIKQKIIKTSKAVAIALKIGWILTIVAMVAILIGIGVLVLASSGVSYSLQQALTIASQSASASGITVSNLVVAAGLGIIQLIFIFMILFTLYQIFSAISRDYTPFTEGNGKRMRKAAIWTVGMCVVACVTDGIADKLLTGEATFGLNFVWIILAAVIYCIALIFDYGCQLQQQSDETL